MQPCVVLITVVSADWQDGVLMLHLNRAPEVGWIQCFQRPRQSYRIVGGTYPSMYQFNSNTGRVRADEHLAQTVLDQFRTFSNMATTAYQEDLNRKANEQESAERSKIAAERSAAEVRARVLNKLKI